jgi:Sec-independent protein secretion pathway component TatC
MAISLALVFAIVIAPDALKIPLAVLSILTLLLGIGMLMMGGKKRKEE